MMMSPLLREGKSQTSTVRMVRQMPRRRQRFADPHRPVVQLVPEVSGAGGIAAAAAGPVVAAGGEAADPSKRSQ